MADAPRWRVPLDGEFLWRQWDDEYVLYHANSGDTHVLNPLGAHALRHLSAGPLTSEELMARLAIGLDVETDAELVSAVQDALRRFESLGLIEQVDDGRTSPQV